MENNQCPHYVTQAECEKRRKVCMDKEEETEDKLVQIMLQVQQNQMNISGVQKLLGWGLGIIGSVCGTLLVKLLLGG